MESKIEVLLANTTAIKQYEGLKHSDDGDDAVYLAPLMRLGLLSEGTIYPEAERAVRDLLRKRSQLVRQRTVNILAIENLVARNSGCSINGKQVYGPTGDFTRVLLIWRRRPCSIDRFRAF